mmetsp:Transcript_21201/g.55286  ORF Transcript_21201/g.55286 Transcript_21201/m.55286 type:complete len:398 (+) Transcript_21201:1565-2758(+)
MRGVFAALAGLAQLDFGVVQLPRPKANIHIQPQPLLFLGLATSRQPKQCWVCIALALLHVRHVPLRVILARNLLVDVVVEKFELEILPRVADPLLLHPLFGVPGAPCQVGLELAPDVAALAWRPLLLRIVHRVEAVRSRDDAHVRQHLPRPEDLSLFRRLQVLRLTHKLLQQFELAVLHDVHYPPPNHPGVRLGIGVEQRHCCPGRSGSDETGCSPAESHRRRCTKPGRPFRKRCCAAVAWGERGVHAGCPTGSSVPIAVVVHRGSAPRHGLHRLDGGVGSQHLLKCLLLLRPVPLQMRFVLFQILIPGVGQRLVDRPQQSLTLLVLQVLIHARFAVLWLLRRNVHLHVELVALPHKRLEVHPTARVQQLGVGVLDGSVGPAVVPAEACRDFDHLGR